jgi:hypothetical protein
MKRFGLLRMAGFLSPNPPADRSWLRLRWITGMTS